MPDRGAGRRDPRVIAIGAGMSGIALGHALKRRGYEDFVILEKGTDVGGVWHWNRYPGLSCDVPSHLYQYSFDLKADWRRLFATGPEIQTYHREVADRHGILEHVRLGCEATAARRTEEGWIVEAADGSTYTGDFLVAATGVLHHPNLPTIPGMEDFEGTLLHSARWSEEVETAGRRVGVIGTGSTGVQLVSALQPVASRVVNFVRTPQWILWGPTELRQSRLLAALLARAPGLHRALYRTSLGMSSILADVATRPSWRRTLVQALARAHLRTVRDPALRAKLTPTDEPLCKRQVVSGSYYRAVQQPNVATVTERIERFEPNGVRTADGTLHELDVVVLATGFKAHRYMQPMRIEGRDGANLDDAWRGGPRAYRMTAMPGFPNFFMMLGPNSPVGSIPLHFSAELSADFIIDWLDEFAAGRLSAVEPTAEATDRFNAQVAAALGPTVWNTGCDSWYLKEDGTVDLWPFDRRTMERMLGSPDPSDFKITRVGEPAEAGA